MASIFFFPPGDVLMNINGIDLTNLSHSEAVAMLKASAASSVVALKALEVQITEEQPQANDEQPSTISENEYDASWSPSWVMWLGLPRYCYFDLWSSAFLAFLFGQASGVAFRPPD